MNPYKKIYTDYERALVQAGRQALLDRWNSRPFTDGQPPTFRVRLGGEYMTGNEVQCEFVASPAAPALTPAWDRELRSMGLIPEHDSRQFAVYVPDGRHLARRWFPCSHDRTCIGETILYATLAAAMAYLAATVAWTGPGGAHPGQV